MQHVNFKYVDNETIVIIFAELSRFDKSASECATSQDIMMYILKNIGEMHNQPEWLRCDSYTRIFEACEIAGFTEDKLIKYQKDMYDEKRLRGEQSAYLRMGLEQGLKEGREVGREEGMFEGKAEIVRQMYNNGLRKEQIIELTGIPISELDKMLSR